MGPIKEADNEFRIRTNEELQAEPKRKDIVQKIKQQGIKWLGHVWRSGEESVIKLLVEWKPGGKKRRGRPISKWLEEVVEDFLTRQGKSVATTMKEMSLVYGDSCPGKTMVYKWHSLFKQGRESLEDDPRPGGALR
ncbi:hypothetical protein MML48_9g00016411 [Holotrichia oblita]|uniref:Uncharacterized protein n=1 Tax=Holotrichia oblita TaxID=644536 RepID=A0ACB9SIY7_HOLOL|nr:hypothetical protein MML48_9g00016411 [Holotrichia oblita]